MTLLETFQEMMNRIYFSRDSKRGIEETFERLMEEVNELRDAMQSTNKKALEDEFADVLAWLASLANLTDVNLGKAALKKYNSCCPKCSASPCKCTF